MDVLAPTGNHRCLGFTAAIMWKRVHAATRVSRGHEGTTLSILENKLLVAPLDISDEFSPTCELYGLFSRLVHARLHVRTPPLVRLAVDPSRVMLHGVTSRTALRFRVVIVAAAHSSDHRHD